MPAMPAMQRSRMAGGASSHRKKRSPPPDDSSQIFSGARLPAPSRPLVLQLTTRLRNILREYPEGIGPFKEFMQNADDASARDFGLILDNSDPLRPALLVYNNGVSATNRRVGRA